MPTIQEITALRRSGHLDEAFQGAEELFAQRANNFTAGALFWCLKVLFYQQDMEDAKATLERMESLYTDYCQGDEYMQRALAAARCYLVPHCQEIRAAVEEAKNGGGAVNLYNRFNQLFQAHELDVSLYPNFGWLIYYALKNTPVDKVLERKTMLAQYLSLELVKPSILHSMILSEAVKVEQNTPLQFRIRDFVHLWSLDNLRVEDWQQYTKKDGIVIPSLVEKLIAVYAKELKTDNVAASEEFERLVDKALKQFPNNQNLPYHKALVLLSQGKRADAIDCYRELIQHYPSKYYLWYQAANLVDDAEIRIGLLCKAISSEQNEQFIGNVRLQLAKQLIANGNRANAKYELEKYKTFYQSEGWNLKNEFWSLYNQLGDVVPTNDNRGLYSQYAIKAEGFVYGNLPEQIAIKVSETQIDDRNHPGRKITQWTLRTEDGVLKLRKPNKYGLDRKVQVGTAYSVRVKDGRIVWIKASGAIPEAEWIKTENGQIRLRTDKNGKQYAFVGSVYINGKLLTSVSDGQDVKVLALKQSDGRWSAVSLTKI